MQSSSSEYLDQAVNALSSLPGVGRKTALRLALYLLHQPLEQTEYFCQSIDGMRKNIKFCTRCHNLADDVLCRVCANPQRNQGLICLVEGLREAMAIEQTRQYNGTYHILGGLIQPLEGIGPQDLNFGSLLKRVEEGDIEEIILALSPSIEGETTAYYLAKQLEGKGIKLSSIARGVSFGSELEYADELTLTRSIQSRLPYQNRE